MGAFGACVDSAGAGAGAGAGIGVALLLDSGAGVVALERVTLRTGLLRVVSESASFSGVDADSSGVNGDGAAFVDDVVTVLCFALLRVVVREVDV